MLSTAVIVIKYRAIEPIGLKGQRTRRRRKKAVPRAAAGYARQLKVMAIQQMQLTM